MYDPFQFSWNFPSIGLTVFSKILLKTKSSSRNECGFAYQLYRFVSLCWYDAISTAAASRSSSVISKSLVTFIIGFFTDFSSKCRYPNLRRNYCLHRIGKGEWQYPSWLLTGCSIGPKNSGRFSTHFLLVECRRFFKAVKRVLLDASTWPLICGYRGVEYKFMIFI